MIAQIIFPTPNIPEGDSADKAMQTVWCLSHLSIPSLQFILPLNSM